MKDTREEQVTLPSAIELAAEAVGAGAGAGAGKGRDVKLDIKEIPKRWAHGYPKEAWRWSEDCKCYLHYIGVMMLPDSYCLGDRMIYADYGLDSFGVLWKGSSSINWAGYQFGYDLKTAIQFLHASKHQNLGCSLWSK